MITNEKGNEEQEEMMVPWLAAVLMFLKVQSSECVRLPMGNLFIFREL